MARPVKRRRLRRHRHAPASPNSPASTTTQVSHTAPISLTAPVKVTPAPRWSDLVLLSGLILAVLLAYHPAWHGTALWDDDGHLTRPDLRSLHGLWRVWSELGATQQYYPLVHSLFWILARLWGDDPLAYHLLNIVLHSVSAFLLVIILRRLTVPGAVLAGVLFALHPVQVESVAWMTELKNTLSGVLYLGSALTYLQFDRDRKTWTYGGALVLFVLALLSKTVAATLPAGLLVVFWWQRGTLAWRRDAVPLLPFLALGAAAGLMTSWVERTLIGATGAAFSLSLVERCLVAGRAITFYLSKLLFPVNLMFMYPRWEVSQTIWWQYLYPLAVLAALAGLWLVRDRTRAPLAAALYFCVTLSPALGFVNVYPFKYSFVADHFQYLASIGIIALVAATCVELVQRWSPASPATAQAVLALVLGTPLALLTRNESRQYTSAETLYLETINRNPGSWLAHSNLAMLRLHRSAADFQDAFTHLQIALAIDPKEPLIRNNIGTALMETGHLAEALEQHREAVRLAPGYAEAYGNMGTDLYKLGRFEEAVDAYRAALSIKPQLVVFRSSLGIALEKVGQPEEAAVEIREALKIAPQSVDDHNALGDALLRVGRADDAIAQYRTALTLDPLSVQTQDNLGYALWKAGRVDDAAAHLREAIRLQPGDTAAHDNLGNVLQAMGRLDEAVVEYKKALDAASAVNAADIHNDLGVALARLGRREEALAHFREAVRLRPEFPAAQANLARALGSMH